MQINLAMLLSEQRHCYFSRCGSTVVSKLRSSEQDLQGLE